MGKYFLFISLLELIPLGLVNDYSLTRWSISHPSFRFNHSLPDHFSIQRLFHHKKFPRCSSSTVSCLCNYHRTSKTTEISIDQ